MSSNQPQNLDYGEFPQQQQNSAIAASNGLLLAAVIFLFAVVVFVFLLYLYAKRYLGANPLLARSSSTRIIFTNTITSPFPSRGLDANVLNSLPVTIYDKQDEPSAEPLDCPVCLSEIASGEKARLLPKCGHGFHLECIDMWFHSHNTCPLCRAPVGPEQQDNGNELETPVSETHFSSETAVFPTNVLFWGTQDNVNTRVPIQEAGTSSSSASAPRNHALVIDVPSRGVVMEGIPSSPLPSSRMVIGEDMNMNMKSPVSARLKSFRKLLSRGKQAIGGVGSSCSPRGGVGDLEMGMSGMERGARTPKTPTI